jgi:hypothetical protein
MMLARLALPALLIPIATTATAAAQTVVATDGYARPAAPRRLEGRLGLLLGGSDVGDADGFSTGLTTGLGYRIGDVTLRGRFDYYRVGDGDDEAMDRRGRAARLGGAARYSLASTRASRQGGGAGVDFWGELGAGLEHVWWRRGGVLDRPSGELAVGFDVDVYGERDAHDRRRHIGYFMAFRSLVGRGPEMEGPAVCGGPCTRATRPSRIDTSMFLELGVHWGR